MLLLGAFTFSVYVKNWLPVWPTVGEQIWIMFWARRAAEGRPCLTDSFTFFLPFSRAAAFHTSLLYLHLNAESLTRKACHTIIN